MVKKSNSKVFSIRGHKRQCLVDAYDNINAGNYISGTAGGPGSGGARYTDAGGDGGCRGVQCKKCFL